MPSKRKKIRQHNHEIGYWTGGKKDRGRFEALTTFGLRLCKHVSAPSELPNETCFMVRVTQKMDGGRTVERSYGFLPWYNGAIHQDLAVALGSCIPAGALVSSLSPSQTKLFLIRRCKQFFEIPLDADDSSESSSDEESDESHGKRFQAVTCTGRQLGSDVFVFGPTLHLSVDGDVIPEEQQMHVWVPRILHKLNRVVNPLRELPQPEWNNPIQRVVQGLQEIVGDNVLSGVFLVGAAIISMFYDTIQRRFQAVGIHIAVSGVSTGKSNSAKVAIATVGNYPKGYTIYLTDSMARAYLSGALPFVYDDPSSDAVLKPLLMNSFGGAEIGTKRQQFASRCSPIVTANEFVLDDLVKADKRYLARALLVPFQYTPPSVSPDVLDDLLQNAPSALPQAIQIGKHFQQCDGAVLSATVEKIQKEFESRLDGRLAMQYALSIQSAEMIVSEANIPDISLESVWDHFVDVMVPIIRRYQLVENKTSDHDLGQALLDLTATMKSENKATEVLKFANPWIRYRPPESTELIPGVAIALKAFIKSMDDYDLPHLTEKAVRRQLRADRRCTTHSHQ